MGKSVIVIHWHPFKPRLGNVGKVSMLAGRRKRGKVWEAPVIYFIQDSATLYIKIGFTASEPEARKAALQTGNPSPLVLLAVMDGDKETESRLHRRFAAQRVAGEWFRPAPDLLLWIIQCAKSEMAKQFRDAALATYAEAQAESISLCNPQATAPNARPAVDLPIGSLVRHARYGRGYVSKFDGQGACQTVTLRFIDGFVRLFKVSHVKLEVIRPALPAQREELNGSNS